MAVSDSDLSNALLVSTRDGSYPDSEEILTADLAPAILGPSIRLIEQAKNQIETEIRGLSQNSSASVDEWIAQARLLQEDIERSKAVAREIVKEHEKCQNLSARVRDAEAKLALLQHETSFNQVVTASLEEICSLDNDLNDAESVLAAGNLVELVAVVEHLSSRIKLAKDSNAKEINLARFSRLQDVLVEGFTKALDAMVDFRKVDGQQKLIVNHGNHDSLDVPLDYLLEALGRLDSLDASLRPISKTFRRKICQPILSRALGAVDCAIDEASHCLILSFGDSPKSPQTVLASLSSIFIFLNTQFPAKLGSAIGTALSGELLDILIRDWLTPAIPLSPSDLLEFRGIQATVADLAALTSSYQWPGDKELTTWLETIPQIWLEKRHTSALDAVRRVLKAPRGPNTQAKRIERQKLSGYDEVSSENVAGDSNVNGADVQHAAVAIPVSGANKEEEEDLSGWDFEDTENVISPIPSPTRSNGDLEDGSDAWGWEEDNPDDTRAEDPRPRAARDAKLPINGSKEHREVTLIEFYTITDIPEKLLDIISAEVRDATQVKSPEFAAFTGTSASSGLLSLPIRILAMFRAIAPGHYASTISNGNMHLYNDCVYVVERLRSLEKATMPVELLDDCKVLEKFAKSAYAREMVVQRTILSDFLDGAQGFINCTRFPYSAECENAVSSTVDRLRAVHRDWSSILSHSALLQSTGSLLSTVIEKVVKDVEEMEDISEAESQRLTAFCGQFSALEDLFLSEQAGPVEMGNAESVPLTAVYVPSWLRFQYLSNILESSLVDIKYLWLEGELSLEFTADEVIELIQALFAESSHRRNAIAEIRRNRS